MGGGAEETCSEALDRIDKLRDGLDDAGCSGLECGLLLARFVFCAYADLIGIFQPRGLFLGRLNARTRGDGSDLGWWLTRVFTVLATPESRRVSGLEADLVCFPHIPGAFFQETLRLPSFDSNLRDRLIQLCQVDWSAISPTIFGSILQSVMAKPARRAQGSHYTNEKNILKLMNPLFMDGLWADFRRLQGSSSPTRRQELQAFHQGLGEVTVFDPACGCGNVLIIAYRELRALELDVMRERRGDQATVASVIDLGQVYGIDICPLSAQITEIALLVMDRIMTNGGEGENCVGLGPTPCRPRPRIVVGNALRLPWDEVIAATRCRYIFGNPPFVGHQWRTKSQQADMARVWDDAGRFNRLDYVTCWFKAAMTYAASHRSIQIAFVATSSITQGEQAGILWPVMFAGGLSIKFAHRSFQWHSEARGRATVHCVIIGLTFAKPDQCLIYDYRHARGEARPVQVSGLNGYLIEGPHDAVPARSKPHPGLLRMHKGSQPTDGARRRQDQGGIVRDSNLILTEQDRDALLALEPHCAAWLRPYVGGDELISGTWRWCLWLKGVDAVELRKSKAVSARLERVRQSRLESPTPSVRDFARFPALFTQDRQPDTPYLAIPEVSSEFRQYLPIAILPPTVIASNKLQIIPNASLLYLGILSSAMHMAWLRTVGGRLENRYSYAPAIYNSFPWPVMSADQEAMISGLAQNILAARDASGGRSLEALYTPEAMPPLLVRAHLALDKAVDRLYRPFPFPFERERVEHLFALREQYRL